MSEIAIIAIELAIKNNEDRVLSLDECVNMIENIGSGGANQSQNSSAVVNKNDTSTIS